MHRSTHPSRRWQPITRVIIAALCSCLVATACAGSGELPSELRPQAIESVRGVAASTGLSLSDLDAGCAADALGTERASGLVDQGEALAPEVLGPETVAGVLDEIIECVGPDTIARSAIAPQAPGASEESIACAADRFDEDLLVTLLAGSDSNGSDSGGSDSTGSESTGSDLGVRLELELATVLAACLSPEELLDLGQ